MAKFAANTRVSVERTQAEIKDTLLRYGADEFGFMQSRIKATIGFVFSGLRIQIDVRLPNPKDEEFTHTPARGTERRREDADALWDQAVRQRWRCLLLAIKAKLEAIESGISTMEQEFLAFVVMPDGKPLHEHVIPKLEQMTVSGEMPKLLPAM